ncbi:hypothetical protein NCLIV_019650 [Neospora caninum Liverpool]|uniref:Probable sulfate transporter 3.5 n=1 Tax=Neospora caninum (strain Liverpool) TaxID=572307 RepID=F0VEN2_NEOCL|nr:hypothetical protein NCLIV_019650 [Neospora caninum Liverpool]CBZ52176.1 hypothetical protein NCLIV_019650 [Neospora caninum Liverpool]CEL66142.1 TPA: Probable sulfate transporter 3.5 [Neospora caninum Liverpool]|eukprot:XP_003882208.1 hypothetical protein NCLIV_019650 [Neospora caninum Liverpool]
MGTDHGQDVFPFNTSGLSDNDRSACKLSDRLDPHETTHEAAVLHPEEHNAQHSSVGVSVCHNKEQDRWPSSVTSPKLSPCSFADDTVGEETECPGRGNLTGVPITQEFERKTSSGACGKPVLSFNKSSIQNRLNQVEGCPLFSRDANETIDAVLPSGDGCPPVYAAHDANSATAYLVAACVANSPKNDMPRNKMEETTARSHTSVANCSAHKKEMADCAQVHSGLRNLSGAEAVIGRGDTTQQESSEALCRFSNFEEKENIVHRGMPASHGGAPRLSMTESHRISSKADDSGIPSCCNTHHHRGELRQNCSSVCVEPTDGGDFPQSFFVYGHRIFSKTPSGGDHTSTVTPQTVGRNLPLPLAVCSCNGCCNAKGCSYTIRQDAQAAQRSADTGVVQRHHIWLRRIRGTPFSVCDNCGTPFDIRPEEEGHSGLNNRHRSRDHSREGEDLRVHGVKGLNGQEYEHEKQPNTTRGDPQQLAIMFSALGEGPSSQRDSSASERLSRPISGYLGRQLPSVPFASSSSSCGIQRHPSVQDRDHNTYSRASSTSTRTSADIHVEPGNGLAANFMSDTAQSRNQRASVLGDGPGCGLSGKSASSFEEITTTSAVSASNTKTCILPLGVRTSGEQTSAAPGSGINNSTRPIDEKTCSFESLDTRHGEKRRNFFRGNSASSDSDDDSERSPPCRCYSLNRTESLFPTSKETDSDGDSYTNGKDTHPNEDDGVCSCSSALESLKGVTWGWGFQAQPRATLSYYFGELKSGLAVPMSQLPATMTCAIVANVPVAAALHGAWITGLISAIFGGSPLSITTVTSSLAVTLAKVTRTTCDEATGVCHEEGLEFIFPALVLAGFCCFLLGLMRLSRFSQFVPSATIVGYLNAVAILNVRAQVETFRFDPVTSTGYEWLWVLLMIIVVFGVMCCWEKIPGIRVNRFIPSSILAIALSSFIEFVFVRRIARMQTKTVASLSTMTEGDLWPKPFFLTPENIKPLSFYMQPSNLMTMLELTLALVMVNYISTLITVDMMSDKVGNMRSEPDQHLVSVGAANTMACFLGALPGSTAPSPSLLNLKVGGKGRESSVFCALVNLALVAASTYLLEYVPLGGLAGIIMYTAYHAFQWRAVAAMFASFLPARLRQKHPVLQRKICRSDAFVMLLTTIIAISADIGTAIFSGVCISACVFAWKNGSRLSITSRVDPESGIKYYRVKGPIFFLTKRKLLRSFDIEHDPPSVVFELTGDACQLFDFGAMETLDTIAARYRKKNKRVRVVGMQRGDKKMIIKAGRMFEFAQIDIVERAIDEGAGPHTIPPIVDMMKLPC